MKALVKKESREGIWLEDVPEPQLGINDVLIKVKRTAICGTDMHIYNRDAWAQKTIPVPMVVGHEFVGEIADVGANVNDFRPGQIVSGEGHVVCGRCRNCMAGRRHLCNQTSGIGVDRPGSFAEYVALPMSNVWEHSPGIDLDVASLFDPFGNATLLCNSTCWEKTYSLPVPDPLAQWRPQYASTRGLVMLSLPTSLIPGWTLPELWAPLAR
jgi:threonine 3-dehydrogenase